MELHFCRRRLNLNNRNPIPASLLKVTYLREYMKGIQAVVGCSYISEK
jgi:hypothetical protein